MEEGCYRLVAYADESEGRPAVSAAVGYLLLHAIDWRAEYRINVVLTFYCTGDKGHAWLTRNGRVFFLSDSMKVNSENLTVVGQTDKYIYYVKERNLQRWYAVDMPACRTGCSDT